MAPNQHLAAKLRDNKSALEEQIRNLMPIMLDLTLITGYSQNVVADQAHLVLHVPIKSLWPAYSNTSNWPEVAFPVQFFFTIEL